MSSSVRSAAFVIALALQGCFSTTLETPADHPANAGAPTSPVTAPGTLRSGFDPTSPAGTDAQSPNPHHHHGHDGHGQAEEAEKNAHPHVH